MKNKFFTSITGGNKGIKEARATQINTKAQRAAEDNVRSLEDEIISLNDKLVTLTDIYPESELSLRVVKDNFDSKEWIASIQNIKVQLANKEIELEIANAIKNEWFGIKSEADGKN